MTTGMVEKAKQVLKAYPQAFGWLGKGTHKTRHKTYEYYESLKIRENIWSLELWALL